MTKKRIFKISYSLTFLFSFLFTITCSLQTKREISTLQKEKDIAKKAAILHEKVLTVDTHVDTPYMLLRPDYDINESHDARKGEGRVDFPRMKQGGLDAIFFATFVGQGPRTPEGNQKAKERVLKLFKTIHNTLKKHPDVAELALSPDDAYRIEKSGKRAIFIGIENGYPIGNDLSLIKKYYNLGARYITLCHTRNNDICDSSTDRKGPEHNGLSKFGKKVVFEMNQIGMMIDVSHISDEAFYDVLEVSKAPVIASHSCSRTVCDNKRNLDDKMLKKLAENGGVIQMCILSSYVKKPEPNPERDAAFKSLREKYKSFSTLSKEERKKFRQGMYSINKKYPRKLATVSEVIDHIDHIVKVAGINHVGIGTDFDGGGGIKDCYDVSEMKNITLELIRRGYTDEQIRKIWGGNTMRVFREVEKVASKLQSKG